MNMLLIFKVEFLELAKSSYRLSQVLVMLVVELGMINLNSSLKDRLCICTRYMTVSITLPKVSDNMMLTTTFQKMKMEIQSCVKIVIWYIGISFILGHLYELNSFYISFYIYVWSNPNNAYSNWANFKYDHLWHMLT